MSTDPSAPEWYYVSEGAQTGPLSLEQLQALAQAGTLTPTDSVWNASLAGWIPAGLVEGLFPAGTYVVAVSPAAAGATETDARPSPAPRQTIPRPAPGPSPSRRSGSRLPALLLVLIPVVVLIVLGTALGLYFSLREPVGADFTSTTSLVPGSGTTDTDQSPSGTPPGEEQQEPSAAEFLPSSRGWHSMVYDTGGDQVVLFGGTCYDTPMGDTWVYDPLESTWFDLCPSGDLPSERSSHAMAYDPVSAKVILFGGWNTFKYTSDTWAYDPALNAWTMLEPAGPLPAARAYHTLTYDPATRKMILFGGSDDSTVFGDTWAYDPAANTWTKLEPAGLAPAARAFHSVAYDSDAGQMILFGGWNDTSQFGDTWAYDPATGAWTDLNPDGDEPTGRQSPAMAYDPVSGKVILFGGWSGSNWVDYTCAYDVAANTWAYLYPSSDQPTARAGHSMVYDPEREQIILFGGWDGLDSLGDMWVYDPADGIWTDLSPGAGWLVSSTGEGRG